jgi:hypothetical protein
MINKGIPTTEIWPYFKTIAGRYRFCLSPEISNEQVEFVIETIHKFYAK